MEIELKLKNSKSSNNTIVSFFSYILYSDKDRLVVSLKKDNELKILQKGTRFLIGDLFIKAYEITGINEYPQRLDEKNKVIFTLDEVNLRTSDDLVNKIAYNG